MTYAAHIIADSIANGVRLTTMEIVFPRIVLAEFNTHRMFSRNSASSRAIPIEKRIAAVRDNPFVPESFGKNQKGMQAIEDLDAASTGRARAAWMVACMNACSRAEELAAIGVHKQLANRLLEPFSWHTVVVTATEWENYFALRCSSLAQPEIRIVSEMMEAAYKKSTPQEIDRGGWHLPYITGEDAAEVIRPGNLSEQLPTLAKISAARCARVSYLTHDGVRDIGKDLQLADSLATNRHMSPFEHPAVVVGSDPDEPFIGNFRRPWRQLRKMMRGEDVAPRETVW